MALRDFPHTYGWSEKMAGQYESEGRRARGLGAPGALERPSHRDPSSFFADLGLLGRLAEEMYGELAFSRAVSAHPRSTLARGDTRTSPPSERFRVDEQEAADERGGDFRTF